MPVINNLNIINYKEIFEIQIDLNPIPVDDNLGKDITFNIKMMDGFQAKN